MTQPQAPEPSRSGGVHRRTNGRGRLPVLLLSLLGIAVAAVVVVVVLRDRGEPAHTTVSPKATHTTAAGASASTTPTPSPVASPSTPITSGNPGPASATSSPTARTASATANPSPTATQASPSTAPAAPAVDVLNDSTVSGMAARAASRLRGGGWQVATVGNYEGTNVPATTIFYPGGARAAAQRLAAKYGVTRVLAAAGSSDSGLSTSDLTLVLARDWKDAG
ncbi:MAG: LytR C-terminal domain-containing protein [Acidothermaceae bacterium]